MAAATSQLSRPVVILIVVAVAVAAAFATWWFFLRESAAPAVETLRRPETLDTSVLRDPRYTALRAPAGVPVPLSRGRANPFRPALTDEGVGSRE